METDSRRYINARRLAGSSAVLVVFLTVIRESTYLFAPESASVGVIDYFLFAASIPLITFGFRTSEKWVRMFLIFLVVFTFLSGLLSQTELGNRLDFVNSVKVLFPTVILVLSLTSKARLNNRQLRFAYVAIALLALIALFRTFGNAASNFVTESRHSTAYLIIGIILIVLSLKIRMVTRFTLLIPLLVPLLVLNVATGIIGLLVFFSLQLANYFKLGPAIRVFLLAAAIFVGVFSRVDIFSVRSSEVGLLGSGRLAAWNDGLRSVLNQDFYTQIFGQGSGSSFQFWGVWWWAQKDIHSDFIRFLIENGLIVFVILATGFIFLYSRLQNNNQVGASLLASALLTAAISNGVLGRPYAAVLWALAAIVAKGVYTENSVVRGDEVFEQPALQKDSRFR